MSQPPPVNKHDNATPTSGPPHGQRQPEKSHIAGWKKNDNNVLVIVATLITTLTYQLGTNLPRGYYQDDKEEHKAGDSILRHKDPNRYWLFITASGIGFGNSMLMTLALLTGVRVESRLIRWPFMVAYSSLVLAFITSQPSITSLPKTSLLFDILLWVIVLFVLWAAITFKRLEGTVRAAPAGLKHLVSLLYSPSSISQ